MRVGVIFATLYVIFEGKYVTSALERNTVRMLLLLLFQWKENLYHLKRTSPQLVDNTTCQCIGASLYPTVAVGHWRALRAQRDQRAQRDLRGQRAPRVLWKCDPLLFRFVHIILTIPATHTTLARRLITLVSFRTTWELEMSFPIIPGTLPLPVPMSQLHLQSSFIKQM